MCDHLSQAINSFKRTKIQNTKISLKMALVISDGRHFSWKCSDNFPVFKEPPLQISRLTGPLNEIINFVAIYMVPGAKDMLTIVFRPIHIGARPRCLGGLHLVRTMTHDLWESNKLIAPSVKTTTHGLRSFRHASRLWAVSLFLQI